MKPPPRNIVCLVRRWAHHTDSGGYDRLAREVGAKIVARRTGQSWVRRLEEFLWWRFPRNRGYLFGYEYVDWFAEASIIVRSWFQRIDAVHVLYGENQLDLLLRRRRLLRAPLVVTFHVPAHRLRERFEEVQKHLRSGIDAAIVNARCQLPDFQRWFGAERVVFMPHGIDTTRFRPSGPPPTGAALRILTVGEHMRDWAALDGIVEQCHRRGLAVTFDIVGWDYVLPFAATAPTVTLHPRLPEETLVRLYGSADALLLPVTDATATNAALESLACGTPVISNRVGGMLDYVDEHCGWFFEKGEVLAIVDLLEAFAKDRSLGLSRREAARRKALECDWSRIARQMLAVYDAVASHRPPGEGLPD